MEFTVLDAIDILLVAYMIYRLMNLIRGTRATTLIKGLAIIFVASVVARLFNLKTVSWLLDRGTTVILVALPVVFYPELRRALEQIGKGQLFSRFNVASRAEIDQTVEQIVSACVGLSARRVGALIAIEREIGLQEYADTGIRVDALVSKELISTIFEPKSLLHDGSVIIRDERIVSAACVLPLTERQIDKRLGTRHRAAVGLSEQTDALIVVVSEETGVVSLAVGGRLIRYLNEKRLKELLNYYWQRISDHPFRRRGE